MANILLWVILGVVVLLVLGGVVFFLTVRQAAEYEEKPPESAPVSVSVPTPVSTPLQLDADVLYEVQQLVASGQKIEAIKRVRAATNLDLKSAKGYVDSLVVPGMTMPSARPLQPVVPTTGQYADSDLPAEALAGVQALMARGRKIEAIKKLREFTGWGLKEAKDYVEAMPPLGSGDVPMPPPPQMSGPNPQALADMDAEVRDLLIYGQKIEAVKLVRQTTGWGLREAKEHVDAIQQQGF